MLRFLLITVGAMAAAEELHAAFAARLKELIDSETKIPTRTPSNTEQSLTGA